MNSKDSDYYRKRAAQERELALAATTSDIANIHLELARKYDELAGQAEVRPTLGIDWGKSVA